MAFSAAERQAKRRAKLKTKGKVLFQAWVTQAHAERIRVLLGGVTYHAPAPDDARRSGENQDLSSPRFRVGVAGFEVKRDWWSRLIPYTLKAFGLHYRTDVIINL